VGPKVPVHRGPRPRTVEAMRTAHWLPVTVAALVCGCTAGNPTTPAPSSAGPSTAAGVTASATHQSTATPSTSPSSSAEAIREWESIAREHFKESATALEQVSEASADEDEAGLLAGCQRLHDTNSIGLQEDLPTPDPQLTAEVQRLIDDMNVATHACLRFALGRDPTDAGNYQQYLTRAVEHLQRAKAILAAARQ
jgi:hypothetical protein